jgi:predicted Zn finger-like uncharacterized protein
MKFTCDSCNAQYMISDEKVGPNGVKVRCKKCGNVILVRHADAKAPAPQPAKAAAPHPGGLDAELGQAFDNAFGDAPAKPPADAPAADSAGQDLGSTQLMSEEDAKKIAAKDAAAPAPAPAPTEWYVAIGEAQVGPLPLPEVKRKWEAGDVGPDSLVWRPGMPDWLPLSAVSDLAGYLAPVPQASRARAAEPRPDAAAPAAAAKPKADAEWKPMGASALAALANEEIAARAEPAAAPAARAAPAAAPGRSLVESMNLPDSGGVDPTGAIPLPIKGLEPSIERKLPQARTSVARGAQQLRRKSAARAVVLGVVLTLLVVGGAVIGAVMYFGGLDAVRRTVSGPAAVVQAPAPVAPAAAAQPPPQPVQAAPAPAPTPTAAPAETVAVAPAPAAPPPAAAAAAEERAEPPAHPKAAASRPAREPTRREATRREAARTARAEPVARKEQPTVARADPEPPPPAPAPAPAAPAKKKDSLLDFDGGGDAALDEALGGKPSGRSVYVPPKPGGDLPAQLSPSQINEAVLGRVDLLRKCVSEQKGRDAEATGTLKMRWIIGGDGAVRDVKCLSPEYATTPFAQCITGVVRAIKFPRSATRGQEVTFPFSF